jgi:hypothetical protein
VPRSICSEGSFISAFLQPFFLSQKAPCDPPQGRFLLAPRRLFLIKWLPYAPQNEPLDSSHIDGVCEIGSWAKTSPYAARRISCTLPNFAFFEKDSLWWFGLGASTGDQDLPSGRHLRRRCSDCLLRQELLLGQMLSVDPMRASATDAISRRNVNYAVAAKNIRRGTDSGDETTALGSYWVNFFPSVSV